MDNDGRVIFGATIKLHNPEVGEIVYQIVGEDEASIPENKISVTSPVARALVGKYEGDNVQVHAPDGAIMYEIIEVTYI